MPVEEGGDVRPGDGDGPVGGQLGLRQAEVTCDHGRVGEGEVLGSGHRDPALPPVEGGPRAVPGGVGPTGQVHGVVRPEHHERASPQAIRRKVLPEGPVHVAPGVDARIGRHRGGRARPADGVARHADPALVDDVGVPPGGTGSCEPVQDVADVGGAGRRDHAGVHTALVEGGAGDTPEGAAAGNTDAVRLVGVVDGGDDVAAGGEVLGEVGERPAETPKPGESSTRG